MMSRSILVIIALFGAVNTAYASSIDNCTLIDNCDNCTASDCHWIQCLNEDPSCQVNEPAEFCNEVSCTIPNTTTVAPPTTTEVPTTEIPTTEIPTTTDAPTDPPTTTTPEPTTPVPETTTAPPTAPPTTPPITTVLPTTEVPTTTEAPTTTAAPPTPSGRHFDPASFFGGMVLAVGIIAVAYAAWRFFKSRNGQTYHTL